MLIERELRPGAKQRRRSCSGAHVAEAPTAIKVAPPDSHNERAESRSHGPFGTVVPAGGDNSATTIG